MAACAMSAQGRHVALIEAKPLTSEQPEQLDVRAIALSLSSIKMLQALGLYAGLQSAVTSISSIHISTSGHFGVTRLHASDLSLDAMGGVVEYHRLMQHLLNSVIQNPSIEVITPAKFESIDQSLDGVTLVINSNATAVQVDASLLLVADGAKSQLRDILGVENSAHDYQQSAIIANVLVEQPKTGWAYERFTSAGPLAMLPLSEGRYAMVWTQKPEKVTSLLGLDDEDFLQQLHQIFGFRLGYFKEIGQRDRFDLKLIRAGQLVVGRCILIGNAANSLHPVAGQGFNLAMRDIGLLYDQLKGLDLAGNELAKSLANYETSRMRDQQQTIRLGHGLVELFSNSLPVLNHARAAALSLLDICPPLKQQFCWTAMGFGTGASSLMRGVR
jgi:2-octaprenyl-6-methoxyphenol hydroxylase